MTPGPQNMSTFKSLKDLHTVFYDGRAVFTSLTNKATALFRPHDLPSTC